LQEVATQKSADQSGDCVADRTEGVLMDWTAAICPPIRPAIIWITRLVTVHVIWAASSGIAARFLTS
jgi:hypothetical protein